MEISVRKYDPNLYFLKGRVGSLYAVLWEEPWDASERKYGTPLWVADRAFCAVTHEKEQHKKPCACQGGGWEFQFR